MGRRFWGLCLGAALILLAGRVVGPYLYARLVLDGRLRRAVERMDAPEVMRLVRQGANPKIVHSLTLPDTRPIILGTPLHTAISRGTAKDVRFLLKRGADPSVEIDMMLGTPLGWAATMDDAEKVSALLEGGAEPNQKDRNGATALYRLADGGVFASSRRGVAVARALLAHGADINTRCPYLTPCAIAEKNGATELAAFLRSSGGKNLQDCLEKIEKAGPLVAVKSGELTAVKRLIARGVRFDLDEKGVETPLMAAATLQHEHVLLHLLQHAAHRSPDWINATNEVGWTALHYAVGRNNNLVIAQALIASGAKVDAVDSFHRTPLIKAIMMGRYGFIKPLLKGGANPDFCPEGDLSARDWARQQAAVGAVTALTKAEQSLRVNRKVN